MIDISSYINPSLAIILWAVGAIIKHSKLLKKVANNNIPVILSVLGIIINVIMNGRNLESVLAGFVTAMVCVGVHKSGRETFNGLDLSSIFKTDTENETSEELDDEEV